VSLSCRLRAQRQRTHESKTLRPPDRPTRERERLDSLAEYDVFGTPPEAAFDALTALAAYVTGAPVSLVSFVDADRVWCKSHVGLEALHVPREISFCAHVVASGGALFVPDAAADERFADNPLVTAGPRIRSYAGVPLRAPNGLVLGALSAIDRRAREFTAEQQDLLGILAGQVIDQLERRRISGLLRASRTELQDADLRSTAALDTAVGVERARGDARLDDSEARSRAIIENAVDSILTIDEFGRVDRVNAAVERMFGYAPDEVIGQNVKMLMPSPDREQHDGYLAACRATGRGRVIGGGINVTARRKDGSTFPASIAVSELTVSGRRLFSGVVRDRTSSEAASERLRRLANVVEQTADAVFMTDLEGRIQYVNPAFEDMTGWTSAEAVGRTPRILRSGKHDRAFYEDLWGTLLRGDVYRATIVNVRKDGTIWYAGQTVTPIRDASGEVASFVALMRDETERRLAVRQKTELALAERIQQRLYPKRSPDVVGIEVGGFVLSASETSGDYYDWGKVEDRRVGIVVADVVGHGFGPALIMAATRSYLRPLLLLGLPPAEMLQRLQSLLNEDLDDGQFVTMLLVQVDLASMRLSYGNAGHPSGLVLDSRGTVKESLATSGPPLGAWPDSTYPESAGVALEAGDLVVLTTDGISECRDASGRFLGDAPVLEVVRAHIGAPVSTILDRIREMLATFTGGIPPEDDATIVVCRVGLGAGTA
jgi:PAS domain S-box-containing protein